MCKGSSGTNTVVQSSSPPPQVLADYQNLINQGQAVSQLPLQQYAGPVLAGFNPTQQTAFGEVNTAQGSALPYINAAQSYLAAGAQPVMDSVQGFNSLGEYENPYTQQVAGSTEALYANQNAQQFNSANASAASAGAFGGDRESVLESQMAQQQALAEDPTLAGIESQGFTGAEQELNTQQQLQLQGGEGSDWLAENAAGLESGLGTTAQNSLLSGASAEMQTGGLGQQLQQEELQVPEGYFQQAQAYPYAATNYLAGITEGAAPGEGGTSTTTSPGPSVLGQIAGLGMTGLGAYGLMNNAGLFSGGSGLSSAGFLAGDTGLADMGFTPASALAGGLIAVRRGGRIGFPSIHRDYGGSVPTLTMPPAPPEPDDFSGALASPWAALMSAGAGMLASRSPFPGVALGEGLQSGLRYAQGQQQAALDHQRASAPHIDVSGDTLRLVYPDGRVFDTKLPTDRQATQQ